MSDIIAMVIGIFIGGFFSHILTKKREAATRLFELKQKAYTPFFELLYNLILNEEFKKKGDEDKEKETADIMGKLKFSLLAYGGSKVINAALNLDDEGGNLISMENLLHAIREDLGHDKFEGYLIPLFVKKSEQQKLIDVYLQEPETKEN